MKRNKPLNHPKTFALAFRRDRGMVIPGEYLEFPQGQFAKRTHYASTAQEMIKFAAKTPDIRLGMIRDAVRPGGVTAHICRIKRILIIPIVPWLP
jgi:hypothetical protein